MFLIIFILERTMAKKKQETNLEDPRKDPKKEFEHFLLLGAFRYYMGRQTILSASIPVDFITFKYHEDLPSSIIDLLINDLEDHIKMFKYFGNPTIDDTRWRKLYNFLKCYRNCEYEFIKVKYDDGSIKTVQCFQSEYFYVPRDIKFEYDENLNPKGIQSEIRYYPVQKYLESPYHEIYIDKDCIVE